MPACFVQPLGRDGRLLFATRSVRMFAYGFLSIVLVLYLKAIGLSDGHVGWRLSMALFGDTLISLGVTTAADRVGRKRMLLAGALLMVLVGVVFVLTTNYALLLAAATIGVLSPSDKEVGPFQAIEQTALAQIVPAPQRTAVFAWYNLAGSLAAALGALTGGFASHELLKITASEATAYRPLVVAYGVVGLLLVLAFTQLSHAAELPDSARLARTRPQAMWLGLHRSRGVVLRLAALFSLDAFGGGFVIQSILAYWFHHRFGLDPATLGSILFFANLLAAGSALAASTLARRFGLINTMVFSHLPSNLLLILVPLMPNLPLAVAMLLLRFSISQMDVPTRQSYTMSVVHADERSAAAGITAVARSIGAALAPALVGWMFELGHFNWPFYVAGVVKIIYDIWLYRAFVAKLPALDDGAPFDASPR